MPLYYYFCFLSVVSIVVRLMFNGLSKRRHEGLGDGHMRVPNQAIRTVNDSQIIPGEMRWQDATSTTVTRHTRSGRVYSSYTLSWNQWIANGKTLQASRMRYSENVYDFFSIKLLLKIMVIWERLIHQTECEIKCIMSEDIFFHLAVILKIDSNTFIHFEKIIRRRLLSKTSIKIIIECADQVFNRDGFPITNEFSARASRQC